MTLKETDSELKAKIVFYLHSAYDEVPKGLPDKLLDLLITERKKIAIAELKENYRASSGMSRRYYEERLVQLGVNANTSSSNLQGKSALSQEDNNKENI